MIAFSWANGLINFGRKLPEGALPIATGEAAKVRKVIEATARLSYDGKHWLVPGVPESGGGNAAVDALVAYALKVKKSLNPPQDSDNDPVARAANKTLAIIDNYVAAYQYYDGESFRHIPSEAESAMIEDAVMGLLANGAFMDALVDQILLVRARKQEVPHGT